MRLATCSHLLFVTFVASTFHISHAVTTIVVAWGIPIDLDSSYEDEIVGVGDTVTFKWGQAIDNNVYIHPSGTCEQENSTFIGDDHNGTSYRFKEEDVGEVFFTSDIPGHCETGQSIKFLVSSSNLLFDTSGIPDISNFDVVVSEEIAGPPPDTSGSPYVFEDYPTTEIILFPYPEVNATDLDIIKEDLDQIQTMEEIIETTDIKEGGLDSMEINEEESDSTEIVEEGQETNMIGESSDSVEIVKEGPGFISRIISSVFSLIRFLVVRIVSLFD